MPGNVPPSGVVSKDNPVTNPPAHLYVPADTGKCAICGRIEAQPWHLGR